MTFRPDGVRLTDGSTTLTLLNQPHYAVHEDAGGRRVEIAHRVAPGGRGRLLLAQGADGELRFVAERLEDLRTGAARLPLGADEAALAAAFPVRPCGPAGALDAGLRGFTFHDRAAPSGGG